MLDAWVWKWVQEWQKPVIKMKRLDWVNLLLNFSKMFFLLVLDWSFLFQCPAALSSLLEAMYLLMLWSCSCECNISGTCHICSLCDISLLDRNFYWIRVFKPVYHLSAKRLPLLLAKRLQRLSVSVISSRCHWSDQSHGLSATLLARKWSPPYFPNWLRRIIWHWRSKT